MIQAAAVNVGPEGGAMHEKLDGHPMHAPPSSATIDEKKESPSATEEEQAEYGMQYAQQQQQIQQSFHQQQQHYHNPYAQHQYPPHMLIPPQQVYIQQQQHQHHMPLESQFHSMGLGETNGTGAVTQNGSTGGEENGNADANGGDGNDEAQKSNDGSDDTNNAGGERQIAGENGDENANDEEPIKLFVGQVPKTMNEEDIFPTFDSFGPLKDVSIIRDKHTQLHRGCAFVTYYSASDAEQAQEALHGKHVFPGARRPAQVKPAEPSVPENKLFIGMLSRKAGEDEVRELFAPFGEIREIYMIRNADGSSKCAAFLRYIGRDSAIQAIENLHNNLVMEGAARPLIVKFADNRHQRQQRHMRNARRGHDMMGVMGPGGAYPGAYPGHHMGMAPPPGGPAHQYHPQMGAPPHHMPQYGAPYPGPAGAMYNPMGYPPHHYGGPHNPYFQNNRQGSGGRRQHPDHNGVPNNNQANNPRPREGPAGANLFVYHLPHDLTDADLATAFNPFGNVISAKVYVDRFTGESKGFGFVSYDSVISAESAIEQMNGFQIGNKRLKVQHKRVHNNGGNRGGKSAPQQEQPPAIVPNEQPQQTTIPTDAPLDAGASATPSGDQAGTAPVS